MMHFITRAEPRRALVCLALLALLAVGCFKLPTVRFEPPFGRSEWVILRDAGIVESPTPAIKVEIVSRTKAPLWVRVLIDDIEGTDDCQNSFRLEAKRSRRYTCPQRVVAAGKRFRAEIIVYRDQGQTKIAERIRRFVDVEADEEGALILVGRPMD
jgi:hypothetical protein